MNWWFNFVDKKRQGNLVFDWFYMKLNAMGEKRMLPWQTMSTFILFGIFLHFLSNPLKPLILLDLLDYCIFQ